MKLIAAVLAAFCLFAAPAARADDASAQKVFDDARNAATTGPAPVKLAGQGELQLPAGRLFVPQPHALRVLQAMGNPGNDPQLHGLVFPQGGDGENWFVIVRYIDAGHVADDDARDWKADELLASVREGTEAANDERVKQGGARLEVQGWAERPAYDAATHRLVWAIDAHDAGAPPDAPDIVNYQTYMLGREGYFALNLVTDAKALPAHRQRAQELLAGLSFDEGRRYADYNGSTDRTAEYGLAALVAGVAAKKLGLLALGAAFFAKFAKLIVLGLAGVGALATKFFKRDKKPGPTA